MPSRRDTVLRRSDGTARANAPALVSPRIDLLGGFELELWGRPARPPLHLHLQRLLVFLALKGPPLQRAYVSGCLWFELSQERANACLRTTLWRINQLPFPLVQVTSTHLMLDPSVAVDARELDACAERVLHNGQPPAGDDVDRLAKARELMPDWYDDWVLNERERVRQLRLFALDAASDGLIQAQRYSEASIAALAAVETDPLRESSYRLLIRSYLGTGNVAEARHQLSVFCGRLRREGLDPSSQLQELAREIK